MKVILEQIQLELKNSVDEKTQNTAQNFFKEEIKAYGVKIPIVNKISKDFFLKIKDNSKTEIFALCEELWKSGFLEESFIACNWTYSLHKQYEENDFKTFERWVQSYVNNWASCDTLCNHTIGEFVEMYPGYISRLKEWATSGNRWMRRASAVTLIIPARKGLFLNDIFQIATTLLHDKDDLVQKGYGWMLKAASEAHQKEVFDFVVKHKATMSRTALRYAIEKMPQEMRAEAMKKLKTENRKAIGSHQCALRVVSVRENPEYKDIAIRYFQKSWPTVLPVIYENCISHSIRAINPLPQWYLLEKEGTVIGCAGLVTNDFISRMDLYPWFCALYIDEKQRGNNYASLLMDKAKEDTVGMGFKYMYLSTNLVSYYEKYGFHYIGQGYHPWGEESRIYEIKLETANY